MNFLGLSRLVAKILLRVGMLKDSETKKAGLLLAGQSYAKVFILDNLGTAQKHRMRCSPMAISHTSAHHICRRSHPACLPAIFNSLAPSRCTRLATGGCRTYSHICAIDARCCHC